MKKSILIPVILSLVFFAVNLYAQDSAKIVSESEDLVVVSKKVVLPVIKEKPTVKQDTEKVVEFTLEEFESESQYKVVVYDIKGNEVFTLRSEKDIEIEKLPANAKLLMRDGRTTYYIYDK
ncbi:hypothetical protein [Chondrinema litorale]|uniref:hypothetical protein n=1 Tax=Chondrinema litorale TaxID=2994555 RepID=UPI00254333EA|nr:hypothetical protein [Chondrinema litorale]UZR92341.1 hypothetical protein OQ292_10760 [Chondrinema litorale]